MYIESEEINMVKLSEYIGRCFYDPANGRYIEPDSVGCDPNVYSCVVSEVTPSGDLEVTERRNFTKYELNHMEVCG